VHLRNVASAYQPYRARSRFADCAARGAWGLRASHPSALGLIRSRAAPIWAGKARPRPARPVRDRGSMTRARQAARTRPARPGGAPRLRSRPDETAPPRLPPWQRQASTPRQRPWRSLRKQAPQPVLRAPHRWCARQCALAAVAQAPPSGRLRMRRETSERQMLWTRPLCRPRRPPPCPQSERATLPQRCRLTVVWIPSPPNVRWCDRHAGHFTRAPWQNRMLADFPVCAHRSLGGRPPGASLRWIAGECGANMAKWRYVYAASRRNTRLALVPPNPNEFDKVTLIGRCRAL